MRPQRRHRSRVPTDAILAIIEEFRRDPRASTGRLSERYEISQTYANFCYYIAQPEYQKYLDEVLAGNISVSDAYKRIRASKRDPEPVPEPIPTPANPEPKPDLSPDLKAWMGFTRELLDTYGLQTLMKLVLQANEERAGIPSYIQNQ